MEKIVVSSAKGVCGMAGSAIVYLIGSLNVAIEWAKFAGLALGAVVGLLTVMNLSLDFYRKWSEMKSKGRSHRYPRKHE